MRYVGKLNWIARLSPYVVRLSAQGRLSHPAPATNCIKNICYPVIN